MKKGEFKEEDMHFKELVLKNLNKDEWLSWIFFPMWLFLYLCACVFTRPILFFAKKLERISNLRDEFWYIPLSILWYILLFILIYLFFPSLII